MRSRPNSKGATRPVEEVSWEDAVAFCRKLSGKERDTYRLPTEAEWEYGCRAGTTTTWYSGDDEAGLKDIAWFHANSANFGTHPVGQKAPNPWGLDDVQGNVLEWCQDWLRDRYDATPPTDDPTGPERGLYRVDRGGAWADDAQYCHAAHRHGLKPSDHHRGLGFRVARSLPEK